jgi:hypothetical protein
MAVVVMMAVVAAALPLALRRLEEVVAAMVVGAVWLSSSEPSSWSSDESIWLTTELRALTAAARWGLEDDLDEDDLDEDVLVVGNDDDGEEVFG